MSDAAVEGEYDDAALIRRQVALALRGLARPGTYVGAARELLLGAVHLATYPLGVARDANRRVTPYGKPREADDPHTDSATAATPVVLLHGYVHNRSAFIGMSRALRKAGFAHIHGFDYNPLAYDIPEVAGMLAGEVERVLALTGADRVQLVGHSMGGVIARYYVQQLGGEDTVDTVLTLGAPHRGTYTAYLGLGRAVGQLRPGSALLRKLEETARPSDVRWVALYSDMDLMVVPAASAKLVHPALRATNVRLDDTGHMSLLLSGHALRTVVEHLCDRSLGRPPAQPEVATIPTVAQRRRRAGQPTTAEPASAKA